MSQIKIVMFGSMGVGKSSITLQFVHRSFNDKYDPTIEEMFKTTMKIGQELIPLEITDTAGQEAYEGFRDTYIRASNGFVLVYEIINHTSYTDLFLIRDKIYRVLDKEKDEHIPICLVGNKCDLGELRKVKKEEAEEMARSWDSLFFEASAKNRINITELYEALVKDVIETNKPCIKKSTCGLL